MIAPSSFLPMITHDAGEISAFDPIWLENAIFHAVIPDGHSRWWSRQVTRAILHYFKSEEVPPIIDLEEIRQIVTSVLQRIGAESAAARFSITPPPISLSLTSLAYEAGQGCEMIFFQKLKSRLQETARQTANCLYVYGLKPCVKYLCGVGRWQKQCQDLEHEIRQHIQATYLALKIRKQDQWVVC